MVIPPQPDHIRDIETAGVFFTLRNGENIVKFDVNVNGDENRRLMGFTSTKVFEASARMAKKGVMDATFKVCLKITL